MKYIYVSRQRQTLVYCGGGSLVVGVVVTLLEKTAELFLSFFLHQVLSLPKKLGQLLGLRRLEAVEVGAYTIK